MSIEKIYLDTCLISGLANYDLKSEEQEALKDIFNLYKQKEIQLVSSDKAKEELEKIPKEWRAKHIEIYDLLDNLPTIPEKRVQDIIGGGFIPFPREDTNLRTLKKILSPKDAEHVFQASSHKCSYFLTVDERTILKHADEINNLVGIEALLPSQLLRRISRGQDN
jgi:hypothetical protein